MKFRFYHGTSNIFLNSIIESGLGGTNPNIKYKNLELLKYLTNKCERKIPNNKDYLHERDAILGMSSQKPVEYKLPNGQNFLQNYEHEHIYVSIVLGRAIMYACDNKYGSEILEYCIKLFKYLKEDNINFSLPSELNLFNIEKYIDKEHKPILIEIDNINEDELETEFGKNASEYISYLKKLAPSLSKIDFHNKLSYANFRLMKPIKKERMKIYEVDYEGKIGTNEFEFTLLKI
jgi:hypothetical protein